MKIQKPDQGEMIFQTSVPNVEEKKPDERSSSVSGHKLKVKPDKIEEKRQELHKKAATIIESQFRSDNRIHEERLRHRENMMRLSSQSARSSEDIKYFQMEKQRLKEEYRITDDSQEQKDLELLLKSEREAAEDAFTIEELERLAELQNETYTEYQSRSLDVQLVTQSLMAELEQNQQEIILDTKEINESNTVDKEGEGMPEAAKRSQEILEAGSKELMGMLWSEVKGELQDKMNQRLDKDKKREKPHNGYPPVMKKQIIESQEVQAEVGNKIKGLIQKMSLLDEDVKGVKINTEFNQIEI